MEIEQDVVNINGVEYVKKGKTFQRATEKCLSAEVMPQEFSPVKLKVEKVKKL
jgi:hypothetical protein